MKPRSIFTIWRVLGLCGLLGCCCCHSYAIDLTSAGSWTRVVTESDLQGGAGSNLVATYTSNASEVSLSVTGTIDVADNWRIDVRRADDIWHDNLSLFVRRTGDGIGPGTISGGGSYQEITLTDAPLFSGAGDRTGVTLQLQLDGMSVSVPAAIYSTTITYTVVDVL